MSNGYKDLKIHGAALDLYAKTHRLTLKLPQYETYALGNQARRASDSIVTNIVEGYGRKNYRSDFLRFLRISHASSLELMCHLEKIGIAHPSLYPESEELATEAEILSKQIHKFLLYVDKHWRSEPL